MQIEERALQRALRGTGAPPHHLQVRIVRTGIGKQAILAALDREARATPPPRLAILAGACGGLTSTADVPTIARIIDERGNTWPAGVGFDPSGVTLIGVDHIVATPADKAALAARTGASIVDMESHAFAAACEARRLPWSVVRGVSDTPHETLPAQVLSWLRPDGTTRTARAALDLLLSPRLVPHIISVMRRANRVLPQVGQRVAALVAQQPHQPVHAEPSPAPARAPAPTASALAAPTTPTHAGHTGHPTAPLPPCVARAAHIIFFGGSFDPVHLGHTLLARAACDHVRSATGQSPAILFIPAARSPHKSAAPGASDPQRAALLRLALTADRRLSFADVWTDELDRAPAAPGTPSYTVDTLRRARAALDARPRPAQAAPVPPARLHLLIGADQLLALHRWRDPHEILALADPLVLLRADDGAGDADSLIARVAATGFWKPDCLARFRAGIVAAPLVPASSTAVREALAAGRPTDGLLDPAVRRFIDDRGLYRSA